MNTGELAIACILRLCRCMVVMPAIAQANDTAVNVANVTVMATPVIKQIAAETATPTPIEAKFRADPTVTLRPVTDVIDKSHDGLVELYMYNPSVNSVRLTADVQVSVPSGIHVYGAGFGSGSAAGTVAGTFTVPPGATRTININIKAENTGTGDSGETGADESNELPIPSGILSVIVIVVAFSALMIRND